MCYNLDGIQDENVVVKETGILVQLKNFLGAFFLVSIECLSSVDTVFDIAFYITNFAYFCGLLWNDDGERFEALFVKVDSLLERKI